LNHSISLFKETERKKKGPIQINVNCEIKDKQFQTSLSSTSFIGKKNLKKRKNFKKNYKKYILVDIMLELNLISILLNVMKSNH
jgi:hypothetical protein